MPAVVPFIPLIAAAVTTTAGAVISNQQVQHAKGQAQAQQTAADAAAKAQGAIGPPQLNKNPMDSNAITQATDAQRRKAALRAGMLSTIATSPTGLTGKPAATPPMAYGGGTKATLG